MNIENYYQLDGKKLSFTRAQASKFAKVVAGDFNQLHDINATRFCVPGDLLFAVILHHYGLRQNMRFSFSGMVNDDDILILPEAENHEISIRDEQDKQYLHISSDGKTSNNPQLMKSLTLNCVAFSGQTFPHILVPLMKEKNAMINTERPLVIYDQMHISLDTLNIDSVSLKHTESLYHTQGKRGEVLLNYDLICEGEQVGKGQKKMLLGGLRAYDQLKIDRLITRVEKNKQAYDE